MRRLSTPAVAALLLLAAATLTPSRAHARVPVTGDITGTVTDSVTGNPIQTAEVRLLQNGGVVTTTLTDAFGRFVIHNLNVGAYTVQVRSLGYRETSQDVRVTGEAAPAFVAFHLSPVPVNLQALEVTATAPIALDTRTGNQVFEQNDYHGAPTQTTSQIVQQSIAGAARAPTGEVHIRGQHAEYTYYVDGLPVSSGLSGSLNELFDPAVVNKIQFQTGGWDAEYGGKTAAVIDISTRIPTGAFHGNFTAYGGSYSSNGQAFDISGNSGKLGLFVSAARQGTDMRQEPVVLDSATNTIQNYSNEGQDGFGFGKLVYTASDRDVITLDVNRSRTRFNVPYDSTGGFLNDKQEDVNGFVNLAWRHRFSGDTTAERTGSEIFVGGFYRDGTLHYIPGAGDEPPFVFYPDTETAYNLSEDRAFHSWGLKADYTLRPHHGLEFKFGTLSSVTGGQEDFTTTDSAGNPGPASNSALDGHDIGVYAQTAISPTDKWELRLGARYDSHVAPFAGNQTQLSPRVRLSYLPSASNTFYLYYGRLFIPTNIEDLRSITSVADSGVVTTPTLPERDNFYEVGYIHRFPAGITTKLAGYYKQSTPGIDDNTIPGSAIVTDVNIAQVKITGIEAVLDFHPRGPLSGYLNFALNHAYGIGPITGGFFPEVAPSGYFDLDHDQRISALANLVYSARHGFYVSATGIYGTGLANGNDPDSTYCTGLLCFNSSIKVPPSFILNASAGYAFTVGRTAVIPEVYVDNAFDNTYLLKGAFFSGAVAGRPRTAVLRVRLSV